MTTKLQDSYCLKLLNDPPLIGQIAAATGKNIATVNNWVKTNYKVLATDIRALKCLEKAWGVPAAEFTVQIETPTPEKV